VVVVIVAVVAVVIMVIAVTVIAVLLVVSGANVSNVDTSCCRLIHELKHTHDCRCLVDRHTAVPDTKGQRRS
jgi:hypothetical protein